jgi:hypothetical protein
MPITGKFRTSAEIQKICHISKSRVVALARRHHWDSPHPGLYRGGDADDRTTPDAYLLARARAGLLGRKRLIWDDSYDLDCPQCGGFAVEGDDGGWRCVNGHSGE